MAKVSIGLRGWRFEESEIFDENGEFKALDEIPEDPRERLVRLTYLCEEPCDACYLEHGDENVAQARQATIVYGEPREEVLLCDRHEADFLYWFREAGGSELKGDEEFRDAFHEWFVDGGRAPEGYGGLEHVDTGPEELPDPPSPQEIHERLNENYEGREIDILEFASEEERERYEAAREASCDADHDHGHEHE
jgi:hypothetical protein